MFGRRVAFPRYRGGPPACRAAVQVALPYRDGDFSGAVTVHGGRRAFRGATEGKESHAKNSVAGPNIGSFFRPSGGLQWRFDDEPCAPGAAVGASQCFDDGRAAGGRHGPLV